MNSEADDAPDLDEQNAAFWDELCGTTMAKAVEVTGRTIDDLRRFDEAYLAFYPYLISYLPGDLAGKRVLEIGLGYGTLGGVLVDRGTRYTGIDISPGPVTMMRHRIALAGREAECDAHQGSALALPFADGELDVVVSIGCLHHTGNLTASFAEVRRVLRPGGEAVIMVYNRWSVRRVAGGPGRLLHQMTQHDGHARTRARYDENMDGAAAPYTDFVSTRQLRSLTSGFSSVAIEKRNVSSVPHLPFVRRLALHLGLDRLAGLDLYVRAVA